MTERREPVDRIIDLAVAVPTCALSAARQAIPLAARAGALGTARAVRRLSDAVHELRAADDRTGDPRPEPASPLVEPAADVVAPAESIAADELPIEGYDDLAARQVVARLASLDRADLGRVEAYEREHRSRSTVLGKIAQLTT